MSRSSGTGPDGSKPRRLLSRREFGRVCALLGGCSLAATAAGPVAHAIGPGRPDFGGRGTIFRSRYPLDDPESLVTSTCLGCHGACPIRVATEDHVVAKIDGNPWSPRVRRGRTPSSPEEAARLRGASCARGQARIQNTHDPFRIVRPLQRQGDRGENRWTSVSHSQLEKILFAGSADRRGPGAVLDDPAASLVLAVDPRQADRAVVLSAFAEGVDRVSVHLGHPAPWLTEATGAMTGSREWLLTPRWERASALLIWGADPLASGLDPVGDSLGISRFLSSAGHGPMIVVDPRLSEAAAKADIWLPVKPGGDMALAWMMLRAWHEAGVFESPEDWHASALKRPWRDMEVTAGLGRELIRHTAELLVEAGDGLAVRVGGGVGERPLGIAATEAILRLPALGGATGPGGAMEPTHQPKVLGARPVDELSRRLQGDGKIDALILVGDGGISDSRAQTDLLHALADPHKVGFLAVVATSPNPVTALADVVIPDVTEHERLGLVRRWDGTSLVRPVVEAPLAGEAESPWRRGLEGLLEVIDRRRGGSLDCEAVVRDALAGTGLAEQLSTRGWIGPAPPGDDPPDVNPFGPVVSEPPRLIGRDEIQVLAFRESFGGFVDSTAQYWATPSLRETNEAWIHPETAEAIGASPGDALVLTPDGEEHGLHAHAKLTEEVRPGVVALATGYGHGQGYRGEMVIDGEVIAADRRRALGVDAGTLLSSPGIRVTASPGDHHPPLSELLFPRGGSCDRI